MQLIKLHPRTGSVFLRDQTPGFHQILALEVQQNFLKHFNVSGHSGSYVLLWCVDLQPCPQIRRALGWLQEPFCPWLQFNVFKGDLQNQVGALACAAAESGLWKSGLWCSCFHNSI